MAKTMAATKRRPVAPKVVDRKQGSKTLAVTRWSVQYVKKRPDTRLPAALLLLLYPFGELGHAYAASVPSPWLLAAFAPVVALPVWFGARKVHGDCWYTRIVAVSTALVPVWLAVAAMTGVFDWGVLLGYSVAAVGLWCAYAESEILTERRVRSQAQVEWAPFARQIGLDDSRLLDTTDTRLGKRYKVDIRGTRRTAEGWARSTLATEWAAARGWPKSRVVVREDPKHAGQILVEERTRDPWQEGNVHPILSESSEWVLPAQRSIHDGPVEVGTDPTSGSILAMPLYGKGGARHVMVVATTGGGKTTLVNCVIERVTACDDALVWPIDVAKGTLPSIWGPVADWGAGVGEVTKAMHVLRGLKTVIEMRSASSAGRNHVATPSAPYIAAPVDEAAKLLNHRNARLAADARDLFSFIETEGRSAGVSLIYMSQRGAISHAGTMDVKANASIRAALGVTQSSEMAHVVPDWQEIGAPDMSKYGEGAPGVVLIVVAGKWVAGRVWDLSDLDAVEALAKRRGAPKATLEPAIAARLGEPYATRRAPAKVPAAIAAPVAVEEEYVGDPDTDKEFRSIVESIERIDESIEELEGMQIPEGKRVPLADLIAARKEEEEANRKAKVPDEILGPMLLIYNAAGPEGYSRAELVEIFGAMGVSESKLKRWLRVMVDQGTLARRGNTTNARYVDPERAGPEGGPTS